MSKADYEYPFSPPAEPEASLATSKPSLTREPHKMASMPTPSTVTSTSPNERKAIDQVRRDRTPPKNSNGEIYCDHHECQARPPTFRRPCEWNKHMDRHERPYKCQQPGCEMSQGFTYSGGLLRHQREVHKMHVTAKEPLFCPFPGCIRGIGDGFTRKENLEEHKRRRHSGDPEQTLEGQPFRKRKRLITPQPEGIDYSNNYGVDDDEVVEAADHPYVKRLHTQLAEKDNLIRAQSLEISRLQTVLRNIPTQTIYGVNPNLMSPPTSVRSQGGQHMQRTGRSPMV